MRTSIFYNTQEDAFLDHIKAGKYTQVILLADANTNGFCINVLKRLIPAFSAASLIIIPQGERRKTLDICLLIWNDLERLKADKSTLLVNVGGGMISDIGGFAASVYKRGIDVINIPTTLLAMVDACYGGKTGIDLNGIKNHLGTFHHPVAIYVNTAFLSTLDQRILRSGISECIKHALISSEATWNKIRDYDIEQFISPDSVKAFLEIKTAIVDQDEKDTGIRQTLNFGHSMGHAIESYSLQTDQPLLHGEAIFLGMLHELKLSEIIFQLPPSVYHDLKKVGEPFFETSSFSYTYRDIDPYLMQDKKNRDGIRMSLLRTIGDCSIQTLVSMEQLRDSF